MKYVKYVQYEKENENGCFISVFQGDSWSSLELEDPDTSNDNECIGEALYEVCSECELPKLICSEGVIEAGPEILCDCEEQEAR